MNKENESYRVESLHNDRKNNRPNGHQSMPRQRTTKRRFTSMIQCAPSASIYILTNQLFSSGLEVDVHFTHTMAPGLSIQSAFHLAS
jgi:hypothetical protein